MKPIVAESGFSKMSSDEISELPSLLLQRLPKAAQFYSVVQLSLNHEFSEEQEFFRYDGLDKCVTCYAGRVVTCKPDKEHWMLVAPLTESDELITKILEKLLVLVDWSHEVSFNAVDDAISNHLNTCCKAVSKVTPALYYMSQYYIPIETALNMHPSLPEDSYFRPLKKDDMDTIFGNWIYASANSDVTFIEDSALQLGSLGLIVGGVLVSWGMHLRDGGIHVVHTLEEYRGRGYGKVLMQRMCRSAAETNQFPVVHVEDGNESSTKMMKSVGFIFSHKITWTEFDV